MSCPQTWKAMGAYGQYELGRWELKDVTRYRLYGYDVVCQSRQAVFRTIKIRDQPIAWGDLTRYKNPVRYKNRWHLDPIRHFDSDTARLLDELEREGDNNG